MFHKIRTVNLFVHDFEKCLSFYRDALALEVIRLEPTFVAFKMDDHELHLLQIADGANVLGVDLSAFESQTGKLDRVLLCSQVDNVDAVYHTLSANGVEFTKAPVDQPWGIRAAYFHDPEGNIWEINHPLAS
ncbi:MAG: VOC family protein [Anaerolineae bacterium]|nr:VOC family protein [Anaerolineae bacterium]